MTDPPTLPFTALTARCGSWCNHSETGADPYQIALAMLGHWRARHREQLEEPFLTRCARPGCGRSCWGQFCCAMCFASDDGGAPLGPWEPGAAAAAVHEQACEDRARRRHAAWYAGSARG